MIGCLSFLLFCFCFVLFVVYFLVFLGTYTHATTKTPFFSNQVTLVSMDGDKFEVKKRSICNSTWGSELVKTMAGAEDEEGGSEGSSDEAENEEIPLPNVNTAVLTKVCKI